jgi:hypothetical protein
MRGSKKPSNSSVRRNPNLQNPDHTMPRIINKKIICPVNKDLRAYLRIYGREMELPIQYSDLLRYTDQVTLYDKKGEDTLWVSLLYAQSDLDHINESLKLIYAILKASGDLSVMRHLYVDRVDLCLYGNTKPFRVRIVNRINDNYDYFYVKQADASRIFGLELEHLLSPNRISFGVHEDTLIEEHIAGIPGADFIENYVKKSRLENELRLAKEFVKFNERCFVRLLGDMHSSNFVIDITPDFEDIHYRIRAIDFDQQSYEARKAVYMPKYFKQNMPIIEIGIRNMTPETAHQYRKEERAMIAHRIRYSERQVDDLLEVMMATPLARPENVFQLRKELDAHYQTNRFSKCTSMGEIVKVSLDLLIENN